MKAFLVGINLSA